MPGAHIVRGVSYQDRVGLLEHVAVLLERAPSSKPHQRWSVHVIHAVRADAGIDEARQVERAQLLLGDRRSARPRALISDRRDWNAPESASANLVSSGSVGSMPWSLSVSPMIARSVRPGISATCSK